jgi:hypothetical protein
MPYSIKTKDGIQINNIPDDLAPDAQELKDAVAKIRAQQSGTEPAKPTLGLGDMASQSVQNIPSSALRLASDLGQAVMHPIDTITGLASTAQGFIDKASGNMEVSPEAEERKQKADAMIGFLDDRYGSEENLKQTIATDPVGFLADVSSVVIPAGGAVAAAGKGLATTGKLAKMTSALERAGGSLARGGAAVEPLNMALRGVGKGIQAIPVTVPERMMKSALKISKKVSDADKTAIARTALDESIPLSRAGLEKVQDLKHVLGKEIDAKVQELQKSGQAIRTEFLLSDIQGVMDNAGLMVPPQTRTVQRIIEQTMEGLPEVLTPSQIQKLKRNLQNRVAEQYGKTSTPTVQVQKNIARQARIELEQAIPEIAGMNANEATLIKLARAMDEALQRIGNRDLSGIGAPIKMGAGASAAGPAGTALGALAAIADVPRFKAMLARVLDTMQKRGIKIQPTPTAIRLGLVAPTRAEEAKYAE